MMEMLCLKYQKINLTNIGREIKNDWAIVTMCINMLMWVFWKSYIHPKTIQDSTQNFINITFCKTLKKIRDNSAMSVEFNITMNNYNYN